MADDTVEDDDERAIELSSVKAIYPELEIDEGGYAATIDLQVEPVPPLAILFPTLADGVPPLDEQNLRSDDHAGGQAPIVGNSPGDRIQNIYHLSHLPPLALRMSLPDGYPSENPPEICLGTQYSWLPQYKVKELRDAAHTIWEEMSRDQVVFSYIDHLREAAEKGFDLAQGGKILEVPADLKVSLLDFDIKARHARFDSETFECGICLGRLCATERDSKSFANGSSQNRKKAPYAIACSSAHTSFALRVSRNSTIVALLRAISEMSNVWHQNVVSNHENQ